MFDFEEAHSNERTEILSKREFGWTLTAVLHFDSTGKVLSNTKCSFLDELRLAVAGFELLKRKVCKTIFRKIRCCLMKIGQLAPLLLC